MAGHLAWNSWGSGARPPQVSKTGRQRYWMSRQQHLQQIAVSNQACSLARLRSYRRPRPSTVRVHPSRRLVACRTAPLGRPINLHGSTSPHFLEPSSAVKFILEDVMVWAGFLENWFFSDDYLQPAGLANFQGLNLDLKVSARLGCLIVRIPR